MACSGRCLPGFLRGFLRRNPAVAVSSIFILLALTSLSVEGGCEITYQPRYLFVLDDHSTSQAQIGYSVHFSLPSIKNATTSFRTENAMVGGLLCDLRHQRESFSQGPFILIFWTPEHRKVPVTLCRHCPFKLHTVFRS